MEQLDRIIPAKDVAFLDGPKSRRYELNFAWKIFREFIHGFRTLHFVGPCITVFGSARFQEDHPHYQSAREMGRRLQEQTVAGAKATDRAIREHPYQSIGIAFGVGLLIGVLVNRK